MHRISVVLCHLLTKPAQVTVQPGSLQQLQQRQQLKNLGGPTQAP